MRVHPRGHTGDDLPQRRHRPTHSMIVSQASQDGRLRGVGRRPSRPLRQGRRGQPGFQPQAEFPGEDRRLDARNVLVQPAPQDNRAEHRGHRAVRGLGAAAIPGPLNLHSAGHILAVARFQMIEGPFEDDPTRFPKLLLQSGLEAVARLRSRVGPAERDEEPSERDDQRDQAHGQGERGGGERGCPEQSAASSMAHRGALSREEMELVSSPHFTRKPPPLPESLSPA